MLNFSKISKSYNTGNLINMVLEDINITLKDNNISLIMGNSGVGKSTLLNILGCLIKPDNGYLDINQRKVNLKSDDTENIRINNFSYVFQEYNLLPEFTIYENLLIPSYINNLDIIYTKKRINDLLDYMDLMKLKNSFPNCISHGEKQRIAILRSIVSDQKFILADEPTGNLDEINTKIILDLIVKINKELNYTFIIASHDKGFKEISHDIYNIENKKLIKK